MPTLPSSVQPPPCSWRVEKKNTFLASFGGGQSTTIVPCSLVVTPKVIRLALPLTTWLK